MIFTTNIFLFIFLPIFFIIYFGLSILKNETLSKLFLIVSSLFFYGWTNFDHIILLIFFIFSIYVSGIIIDILNKNKSEASYSIFIVFIACLLSLLFYYKYYNSIVAYISILGYKQIPVFIPAGLSFIVFSAITYIVDVYKHNKGVGSLLDVALYISFFPKILSGPIVQWKNFQSQDFLKKITVDNFYSGMKNIIIGLFVKSVIADSLGVVVTTIIADLGEGVDRITVWGCALCYMLQIFFDFAGYSLIAIGLSKCLGFNVDKNFDFPYVSKSVSEFWRRWHISLGAWFREYVYIPLGGNKTGNVYFNLFIVFLLTGIWHGAGLNFLVWGLLNGLAVMCERFISKRTWYEKVPNFLKIATTFIFTYFSWIVFMSPDYNFLSNFLKCMFFKPVKELSVNCLFYFDNKIMFICLLGLIISFFPIYKDCKIINKISKDTLAFKIFESIALFIMLLISIAFIVNSTYKPFLYFQF